MARVLIGLALYNGAEHVAAQLDSIAAQDHRDWRLVVSDDGSSDAGPAIVQEFAARFPPGQVTLIAGPRGGATRNFLSMMALPDGDEYLSLADQDDVWRPDKLGRALAALHARPEAGLYSACTTICDADLTPLAGLAKLEGLTLRGSPATDLAPLAGLQNLVALDLSESAVKDLTPLEGLKSLRMLRLDHAKVKDLTPLTRIKALGRIGAAGLDPALLEPLAPMVARGLTLTQ